MTLTQTVEVPNDRWLKIKVPQEVPIGAVVLTYKPLSKKPEKLSAQEAMERGMGLGAGKRIDPAEAIKRCCGITKQYGISLSNDEFLEMCRQDKEFENRLDGSNL